MSIKKQKIIRFIPLLGMLNVIFWLKLLSKTPNSWNMVAKPIIKILVINILINIPRIVLSYFVDSLTIINLLTMLSFYFSIVTFGWIAVNEQEKIINKTDRNE